MGRFPKLSMSRSWVLKEDIQNREGIKVLDLKEDDDLGHWGVLQ